MVLIVYQDVALQNAKRAAGQMASNIITVSVDEKPGVQAIGNTAPDLPPVPGKHSAISRDHEYKRLGTCSILAALDLQDWPRHRARGGTVTVASRIHLACYQTLTRSMRPTAPSESYWTTTPHTFPRRPRPSYRNTLTVSNTS